MSFLSQLDSAASQLDIVLRIVVAVLLGAIIGYERESTNQPAGLRTHMLVAGGAACFMALSMFGFGAVIEPGRVVLDPSRVAAQIVTGVGFLGAGAIWRTRASVRGLTTAASIWVVAAIGMACGAALYIVAAAFTILGAITLHFLHGPSKRGPRGHFGEPSLVAEPKDDEDDDDSAD
jgi:putative Mg2+ transporter-C (MgtC) family protein